MFRQNLFILFILLGFAANAKLPAGNTLSGIVRDVNGAALQGAVVEIPDLKAGTVTDSNGYYLLENLPTGKFIVVAGEIGFSKSHATVNIIGKVEFAFVLSESAIESKEVVITGQSKATEINRSPVPVVAVNEQFLKENISSNIIDALVKVPGVAAVSTGPNISKPFIRGLGYNRILTLYDGMRQEGQQWGDEHGVEVDEYNVDRVELVKGPASLTYGSDALAGVVNLIPTPPAPEGKVEGEVTAEYQGNNNMAGASGMMSGNANGFYWLGRLSHKQAMDYRDPIDGRVYATNFNETDANASFGLNKKWGYSHLQLSVFNDLQAVPDGSRDSASRQFTRQVTELDSFRPVVTDRELRSYSLPALHQHVQQYRVQSSNNFHVLKGLLVVNLGFERNIRQEYSHPVYTSVPGLDLQLNTYTYDLKYYFHPLNGWEITMGINGMYQVNDATAGTEFIIPSYHQFDVGPFAVFKKAVGKLELAGGMRFDSRTFHSTTLYTSPDPQTGFDHYSGTQSTIGSTLQFAGADHSYSGVTYSLGFAYVFSKKIAVKGNIARGYRAPNIAELSADGVHPGTNIYQVGAGGLKPEFSLQEDIGLEYSSRHLSINLSVFNSDIANYIYNQKVLNASGGDSIKDNATVYRFGSTHAQLYGGEASVDIHPHPLDWLHFENSISIVYGINKGGTGVAVNDDNRNLPQIPPIHGISELRANFKHPNTYVHNTFIKLQVIAYARQDKVYRADNTESVTPGYLLLNGGMGGDIVRRTGKVIFNLSLFGNNLLDKAYQDHLSRLKYFEPYTSDPRGQRGIYSMGRNIGLKIAIPISVK